MRKGVTLTGGGTPHTLGLTSRHQMWWCPLCGTQMRESFRVQHLVVTHKWMSEAQAKIRVKSLRALAGSLDTEFREE